MAQIKFVFLMHDLDQFNGSATDTVHEVMGGGAGFEYPTDDGYTNNIRYTGRTKAELCDNMRPGSTIAKAAFGTKVHANVDAAKTAMGLDDIDTSDASSATWALNDDKTELSLTCDFSSVSVAESWHTEIDKRDPWATAGVVWEDRSKSVWTK